MQDAVAPDTESGAGFEPPTVRQFTVFMDNRVGRLQALVRAYEEAEGRILSLSIHNSVDTALIRLICSDADLARDILRKHNFAFAAQDVLVVELPKGNRQPLTSICAALLAGELSIHYAHSLMVAGGGPALALYVDDPTLGAQLLIKKGFTLIGESDLRK